MPAPDKPIGQDGTFLELTDDNFGPLAEDVAAVEVVSVGDGSLEAIESEVVEDIREKVVKEDLELESLKQDIDLRKDYANRIYWFVVGWVVAALGTVASTGWSWGGFELSDQVLMMLIGGTTANVLGLFAIVANYLFPKKK